MRPHPIQKTLALAFFALSLLASAAESAESAKSEESPEYAQITIKSNDKTWEYLAEVASTPEQRKKGLSGRDEASPMLFDFGYAKTPESVPKQVCMWMKDTLIPLRAVFIAGVSEKVPAEVPAAGGGKTKKVPKPPKKARIIRTARMTPHSRRLHCAEGAAYVLELPDSGELLPKGAKVEIKHVGKKQQ